MNAAGVHAPLVEAVDLWFAHPGHQPILRGCSLRVGAGERVLIRGPNGCGKSTLLHLLCGLAQPQRGQVRLPPEGRRALALLAQEHDIDWDLPFLAWDLVALGLAAGRPWWRPIGSGGRRAVTTALERVGCGHLARRPLVELSGGERRRLLLARTLLQGGQVLLLDEPLSGLDAESRHGLGAVLQSLSETDGLSVVVVSHEVADFPVVFQQDLHFHDGALRPTHEHPCELAP